MLRAAPAPPLRRVCRRGRSAGAPRRRSLDRGLRRARLQQLLGRAGAATRPDHTQISRGWRRRRALREAACAYAQSDSAGAALLLLHLRDEAVEAVFLDDL